MDSKYYEDKLMEETSNDNIDIDAYRMIWRKKTRRTKAWIK